MNSVSERRHLLKELTKTRVVKRLRFISLSSVPPWLCPQVATATRYEHSIAVGNLSLLVIGGTKHERFLLTAAATLHDVGNGPFPHISDQIMRETLGFAHEKAVRFAFEQSPEEDNGVLEKHGLGLQEISFVLEGQHELSPFLYGFPDLDNTDNIYRFLTTIPKKKLGNASYQPSMIAKSMFLDKKTKDLTNDLKAKWARDFRRVYSYLWNNPDNMIYWTMLGRGLRILKEDLTPNFFRLTNKEAFRYMYSRIPKWGDALTKHDFNIVFDKKFKYLNGKSCEMKDPANMKNLEQMLCEEMDLEKWMLGLTVDQPLLREKPDYWRIYLVTYKGNKKPLKLLDNILSESEPYS